MVISTETFILGATSLHSSKSNKDFTKINLVVDGEFCSFFVPAARGAQLTKIKQFGELAKTGAPQKAVATLNVKFTERGTFVDLEELV